MLKIITEQLKPALLALLWMTLLTGLAYPLAVTGLAQALFPAQAGGSLIERDGAALGSRLIGQPFASQRYFKSRPSATAPYEYNAGSSSGSNLGPSNPALVEAAAGRAAKFPADAGVVPMDLLTASGSGLDPHISPEAAAFQVPLVAQARGLAPGPWRPWCASTPRAGCGASGAVPG
jgi:potassium-transporting ATPase KdpC subunit